MSATSVQLLTLVPAIPAVTAAATLIAGRRVDRWGHWLSTAAVAASFALTALLWWRMLLREAVDRPITASLYSWIPVDGLQVDFALRLDQLSVCFALLITGVGTLIHIYSIGYMEHDPDRRRFFAYLNLFIAAMLLLVLADNYVLMYAGWEGVGLASYLLIGFWQYKKSAATAAKKAFVVNRVGDMGFVIALMIIFNHFGSFRISDVLAATATTDDSTLTALGLMLLLAACAKSAQVPLQSWLGDAMEGPTPVSALIHAATMVTAGVYLIVRSGPIFDHAPTAQTAVIVVGAVTLLFGAIIGCAKDDIKKALAASTMSQIGYMVLAAGLGPTGYVFAIAHLLAHGFFKAGLFLGSGAVMHAMNDETDMRRYGGLRRAMPITFATFGLAYLAIIGIPPLAGFFTKDHIIEAAFGAGGIRGPILGIVTVVGAGLTAFYMTRVMLLTFFGEPRWKDSDDPVHPHEAPPSMTGPMIILAFGSVGAGALLILGGRLSHWLAPITGEEHADLPVPAWVISAGVLAVVAVGIAVAWRMYSESVPRIAPAGSALTRAARADLYGDRFNESVLMAPGQQLTTMLSVVEDRGFGGAEAGLARGVDSGSQLLRRTQNGYVRSYALSILSGAVIIAAVILAVGL